MYCIYCLICPGFGGDGDPHGDATVTVEEFLVTVGAKVGYGNVTYTSWMNKAVVAFLKEERLVDRMVKHLVLKEECLVDRMVKHVVLKEECLVDRMLYLIELEEQ